MAEQQKTNFKELTYTYTIYPEPIHSKPSGKNKKKIIGRISNGINVVTTTTIDEFAKNVVNGITFSCGLFDGHINNSNWTIQYSVALDFDKGKLSIYDVYARFEPYDIKPQVIYYTYGSTSELEKFRIVMFLDFPITSEEQRAFIMEKLFVIFPEADDNCVNAGRFYFGGTKSYVVTYEPVKLQNLVDFIGTKIISKDGNRTRKLPVNPFQYSNTSNSDIGKIWYFLLDNNSNYQNLPYYNPSTLKGVQQTKINWDKARKNVKILDDFLNGIWLFHPQFHGLATNLMYVNGGFKLMKATMRKYNKEGKTDYGPEKFSHLTYLGKVKYPAKPIKEFSPYEQDHIYRDIISAGNETKGKVIKLKEIKKAPLSKVENLLKKEIPRILKEGKIGKIYILLLPTAVGKTEIITTAEGVIIAVPTNLLKNEVFGRMQVDSIITPDTIEFESMYINEKRKYFYCIGKHSEATAFLYDIIDEKNAKRFPSDDIKKVKEYLTQIELCKLSEQTVVTTHSRALFNEFQHDTIIFDEDPLNQLIDIKSIKISDLHKLNINANNVFESDLDEVIEYLTNLPAQEVHETRKFDFDIEKYAGNIYSKNLTSNVFEFFNSSYIYRDPHVLDEVHYVVIKQLPEDKKVVIMSATAPIEIYKKLYGNRLEVINLTDVGHKGKIMQYTKRSYSRISLSDNADEIRDLVGDKPVITMKDYKNIFINPVKNMHFGNCEGYNELAGKDLAVVGTPHRNNLEYYLIASAMGHKFEIIPNIMMRHQLVEHNDFQFWFQSFNDTVLRGIQFSLIESDLIQAVGRARTLRTDAKVDLYSNFPLRISDEFIY